jgi:hypothetical protein
VSVEAITWALKQPVQQSSAKFVLVALANCANGANGRAWPSIAYLCEATSQDRKTVMSNLKRLMDAGFIQDTGARMGGTRSVVVYQICCPEFGTAKQSQKGDYLPEEAVPFFPSSSTVFPPKQSRLSVEAVPKTVHGTQRNRNGTVIEKSSVCVNAAHTQIPDEFKNHIRKVRPELDPDLVFANFVSHYPPDKRKFAKWRQWVANERVGVAEAVQAAAADPDTRPNVEKRGVAAGIGKWDDSREQWHQYKARVVEAERVAAEE